jgi:7,8-dihydropterin-6-yl-methyl-4-(beta-D-ribofuranosyl)aminobenzene 5'-phosphate synthase
VIQIVFDNCTPGNVQGDLWGFSAYLPQHKLLLDTGSNGRKLLQNMHRLGIEPTEIEYLFVTHDHWDHIGGIDSILELNPDITLYAPYTLSRNHLRDLRTLAREVVVINRNEPRHLFGDLYTTGMLGGAVPEHSLIIGGDRPSVLTGCGHYGIAKIAAKAAEVIGQPIRSVAGGFHLLEEDEATIRTQIQSLQKQGIEEVIPTHCTGDLAMKLFAEVFGDGYRAGGVG